MLRGLWRCSSEYSGAQRAVEVLIRVLRHSQRAVDILGDGVVAGRSNRQVRNV